MKLYYFILLICFCTACNAQQYLIGDTIFQSGDIFYSYRCERTNENIFTVKIKRTNKSNIPIIITPYQIKLIPSYTDTFLDGSIFRETRDTLMGFFAEIEIEKRLYSREMGINMESPNPLTFLPKDSSDTGIIIEIEAKGAKRTYHFCDMYWLASDTDSIPEYSDRNRFPNVLFCLPIHLY